MKFLLLIMLIFASDENENVFESGTESEARNRAEKSIVKIEEDEHAAERNSYIGVCYVSRDSQWRAQRHSKTEYKIFYNGSYKNEETAALASDTLARKLMANGDKGHILNFPDEDTEVYPEEKTTNYIGLSYIKNLSKWRSQRYSKKENKTVYSGNYKNEEIAAHASDTLARKLIVNGEQGHKLNFPDDDTEVYPEKKTNYFGVYYNRQEVWFVQRWSKNESKNFYNGHFKDEETAAHASDTLARKLIANGEKGHKLNFPDDDTEVYPKEIERTGYIGVSYNKKTQTWRAKRWSKDTKKEVYTGSHKDKQTAAHASDNLARKLIANGEKGHKLNFPDDKTEVHPKFKQANYIGVHHNENKETWCAYRWSKHEKKQVYSGNYKNEETAARASNALARKLTANGEIGHKLNFTDDDTDVHQKGTKDQNEKRKRQNNLGNSQANRSHKNLF